MRLFSSISRRIVGSFAAVVALFAAGSLFAFAGIKEIHEGLHDMRRHEEEARRAVGLASAVRDQYAHQAHTIILGNATHLGLYEQARERVRRLNAEVAREVPDAPRLALAARIEKASLELDRVFREGIFPAVIAHDAAVVQRQHERAQQLVSEIEADADALARMSLAQIGEFEAHAGAVQHTAVLWSVFFLVGATLCAAAIGVSMRRAIARPIALLQAGAEQIGKGDLNTRIHVETADELGQLAGRFNAMAASLKQRQDQLVQSERLAGIGRLAAGVAHELNNPLGVILGYVRLLQRKAEGPVARDLGIIEDEALRCKEIVEGLLDLSRPMKLEGELVDLRAVCDEVVARLRDTGQLSGVEVSVSGTAEVVGSGHRLRQIAMNLIKNAAEAGGAAGRVEVLIQPRGGQATLIVRDTGPGLSEEQRLHLFEPFFTTKPSGTGLGLAMSQAIARAHGGDIGAESGGGSTTFTVRLPLRAAARA